MRKFLVGLLLSFFSLFMFFTPVAWSMEGGGDYGEFQRLMLTPLEKLTEKADRILKNKYERTKDSETSENYMGYSIPYFVMTSESSYVAYRIATAKPQLLARYECYDSCDGRVIRNLLGCFFKDGKPGDYIDLAASCPICQGEAISIFLWDEIGAPPAEIIGGLRFLYDPALHETAPP